MRKIFLLAVTLMTAYSLAKPAGKLLTYYSTGEPLLNALDYAFGSFGYRYAAPPEMLALPWWGEIVGRVTADELPRYMASVLRPMGASVELDANGVFQVVPTSPAFAGEVLDTLLVLDSLAIGHLSEWCQMPNCSYTLLPAPGSVLVRYPRSFAGFVRRISEAAAPLALEEVPAVQVHMLIYRHTSDSALTIGLDYPAVYLPVPDLLHSINLYEESGEIDITARPELHCRPGGKYELFFGSERPYQQNTLHESGAIVTDTHYRKYGLSLALDYERVQDGRHSFTLRLSSSSYNEDGSNVLSETETAVSLPLDSALLVASVDADNVVQRRRGLPFLCDLPLIGRLFGRWVDVHERSRYNVLFWINAGFHGRLALSDTTTAGKRLDYED